MLLDYNDMDMTMTNLKGQAERLDDFRKGHRLISTTADSFHHIASPENCSLSNHRQLGLMPLYMSSR
jgi:hypothetical protein